MNLKNTAIIILMFSILGCSQPENPDHSNKINKDSIVATYNGKNITISDMENHINNLPVENRWSDQNLNEWYKSLIKKVAMDNLLFNYSNYANTNIQSSSYQQNSRAIDRIAYTNQYIKKGSTGINISEDDVKEYYQSNIEQYKFPEQRIVFHLYNAISNNENDVKSNLNKLREKIINGENFNLIANQYSESESRHKDGYLGVFKKHDKPVALTDILFSLKKNIPSEPIRLGKGYHLFYVSEIIKQKNFELDSVQAQIIEQLKQGTYSKLLRQKALELPKPTPFLIPNDNELENIIQSDSKIILKIGEFQLTYPQLLNELYIYKTNDGYLNENEINQQVLQDIGYSEIIYQSMIQDEEPLEFIETINKLKRQLTINENKKAYIVQYLNNNPNLLIDYYNKNIKRFYSPVYLNLIKISIPIQTNKLIMPILENNYKNQNNLEDYFSKLEVQYGGNIENLGLKSTKELESSHKKILSFAINLELGEFSPPFTINDNYVILKMNDKIESKEQAFDDVEDEITARYLSENGNYIYSLIVKKELADLQFNDKIISNFLSNPIIN